VAEPGRNNQLADDSRRALRPPPACIQKSPASAPMAQLVPGALGPCRRGSDSRTDELPEPAAWKAWSALVAVAMALALAIKSAPGALDQPAARAGQARVLAVVTRSQNDPELAIFRGC